MIYLLASDPDRQTAICYWDQYDHLGWFTLEWLLSLEKNDIEINQASSMAAIDFGSQMMGVWLDALGLKGPRTLYSKFLTHGPPFKRYSLGKS